MKGFVTGSNSDIQSVPGNIGTFGTYNFTLHFMILFSSLLSNASLMESFNRCARLVEGHAGVHIWRPRRQPHYEHIQADRIPLGRERRSLRIDHGAPGHSNNEFQVSRGNLH